MSQQALIRYVLCQCMLEPIAHVRQNACLLDESQALERFE